MQVAIEIDEDGVYGHILTCFNFVSMGNGSSKESNLKESKNLRI